MLDGNSRAPKWPLHFTALLCVNEQSDLIHWTQRESNKIFWEPIYMSVVSTYFLKHTPKVSNFYIWWILIWLRNSEKTWACWKWPENAVKNPTPITAQKLHMDSKNRGKILWRISILWTFSLSALECILDSPHILDSCQTSKIDT